MPFNTMLRSAVLGAMLLGPLEAFGQWLDRGDTAWISTTTVLVLFMTIPGLALFYGGMVRASAAVPVLTQCFAITFLVTILWLIAGYSLAYGDSLGIVGDLSRVLYQGVGEEALWGTIPESLFATFQLTFAIITPALIVGALVERIRFPAVLLFTALWSLLVYAPVAHWVWGGGWLSELGVMDYAGGIVVHVTAGSAALVAAIMFGRRPGFPDHLEPPHNLPLTVTGAAMLWVGWLGFNGGSAIAADGNAAMAMTVTHISGAAGAFTWMMLEWSRSGKPSALGAVTGMVAGLATVTPGAGFVGPAGALVTGILAGASCLFAAQFIRRVVRIDDSLDVVSVHLVGGALGTLLAAVFASRGLGVFSGQEDISILSQLRVQVVGLMAAFIYTASATWVILVLVNAIVRDRVSEEIVKKGLDFASHGEHGYVLPPQAHDRQMSSDGSMRSTSKEKSGANSP